MRNRLQMKRLAEVERDLAARPIPTASIDRAFEHFVETGELSDNDTLAAAVTDRALKTQPVDFDHRKALEELNELCRLIHEAPEELAKRRRKDRVRKILFREALSDAALTRGAARQVLMLLARCKFDLTQEMPFDAELDIPEYGRLGLHMLEWPTALRVPPYENVADRMFDRIARLQPIMDETPGWRDTLDEHIGAMRTHGRLPEAGAMREATLVDAQLLTLSRQFVGEDVDEVIWALDAAAETSDPEAAEHAVQLYRESWGPAA